MGKDKKERGKLRPTKIVIYKRIRNGRGEERLKIYVDRITRRGRHVYDEVFEERAAFLSEDSENDPRKKNQTRERVLAIMCCDARYYSGEFNTHFILETIPTTSLEQWPDIEERLELVKKDGRDVVLKNGSKLALTLSTSAITGDRGYLEMKDGGRIVLEDETSVLMQYHDVVVRRDIDMPVDPGTIERYANALETAYLDGLARGKISEVLSCALNAGRRNVNSSSNS